MTQPLTAMERRVYEYLLDFTAENTFQPSIREIGKRFRIKSTKTVSDILQALAAKGYIERDASRSRGVRLLGFTGAARTMPVPLVQSGETAVVAEPRAGFVTMDRRFVPSERAFYVRVPGLDMAAAGILAGDLVMVNPEAKPATGDTVAARIRDEVVVRRYARDDEGIALRAADEREPELRIAPSDDVTMLGVVCGVFRPMFEDGLIAPDGIELLTS